ncbi:MAG TPA: hypothetical protein VK447_19305, partial [Myxococcaceae bacterium]|nr:hypothetical protein [Myxococcaceae bacterium]
MMDGLSPGREDADRALELLSGQQSSSWRSSERFGGESNRYRLAARATNTLLESNWLAGGGWTLNLSTLERTCASSTTASRAGRLSLGAGNARDLRNLARSLLCLPAL